MISMANLIPTYEEIKWERTTESRISTVISLLPTSLKSRMPIFPPFRRTASLGSLRAEVENEPLTPCLPRPLSVSGGDVVAEASEQGCIEVKNEAKVRVITRGKTVKTVDDSGKQATLSSGVDWRFGNQGSNLIQVSSETANDNANRDFERKAFIDGLTYLLRALPSDLDEVERDQLRAALPGTLSNGQIEDPVSATPDLSRSLLHRLVQLIVVQAILFVHLILPYAVLMLRGAASVERKYKVSEVVVGHSIQLANALGKRCTHLAEVALGVNNGKIVQGVSSVVVWTVEEVTRGITDGVGEGMLGMRVRDNASLSL